jgi:IS605 OrfB family transposase
MKIFTYKTLIISTPPESFYTVVDSSMLMAKNIANPTLFLIKNILTSFQYNKETKSYHLKEELHLNQKQTIDLFNQVIPIINQERLIKFSEKEQQKLDSQLQKKATDVKDKTKKFIPLSLLVNTLSIQELQKLLTDKSLIENVLREKEKNIDALNNSNTSCCKDYTNIHSFIAQYAVHQTVDNIKNHFKAVATYWKNYKAGDKPSPPQLPKYLDKNQRFTFELHHSRFNNRGNIFTINPNKHKLYSNFHNIEDSLIDLKTIEEFNSYNFKKSLSCEITNKLNSKSKLAKAFIQKNNIILNTNEYIDNMGLVKTYELQTVRFVAHRKTGKGKNKKPLKIEAVVKVETDIADDSPLAKIINYYEKNKAIFKKEKSTYTELLTDIQQKIILHFLAHHDKKIITKKLVTTSKKDLEDNVSSVENVKSNKNIFSRYAGIDLGKNNIASLALTHGKNVVYSGQYINQHLTHLNSKLDEIKSSIFKDFLSNELLVKVLYNHEISELNNFNYQYTNDKVCNEEKLNSYLLKRSNFISQHNLKKEDGKDYVLTDKLDKFKLNTAELKEINIANKVVYQNLNYVKTLVKMENFKKQTLHQLSSEIIQNCIKNKIEILVIGKNTGWKTEVNMGRENNRLFTTLPHAKLIEQIQYKAVLAGIAVITTEESYTSQSSFVHTDEIPRYEKKEKKSKKSKQLGKVKKEVEDKYSQYEENENKLKEPDNNQSQFNLKQEVKVLRNNIIPLGLSNSYNFSGERKSHSYICKATKTAKSKKVVIHADLNGAFNIIRKVIKGFTYTPQIDLSYDLKGVKNKSLRINSLGKRNMIYFSKLIHYKSITS